MALHRICTDPHIHGVRVDRDIGPIIIINYKDRGKLVIIINTLTHQPPRPNPHPQ